MKSKTTIYLAESGVIAALYTVLTIVCAPISFGIVQIRVSEALTVLPLITPAAIPGLFAGCIISNLVGVLSGANIAGAADVAIGSVATLLAAVLTAKLRNVKIKGFPLFSFLQPVLINAVIVGTELFFFTTNSYAVYIFGLSVAAGEAIAVFAVGTVLYAFLNKRNIFRIKYSE